MRAMILFGLGLIIGGAVTAITLNMLAQNSAYPRGLMQVMQRHYSGLRSDLRAGRCSNVTLEAQALRQLAGEVESAVYGSVTPDGPFRKFNQRLQDALTGVLSALTSDCPALAPLVERVGNACEACHQQYR